LRESLFDDLNTSAALSAFWDGLRGGLSPEEKRRLAVLAEDVFALGLFQEEKLEISSELQRLIDERALARKNRDFTRSDSLRKELESKGILVEDTKQGQRWRKK
jgi:cysteinyl-tRNA synthetase